MNVTRSSEDLLDDEHLSLDHLVTQGAAALTRLLDAEVFAPTGRRALYLYRLTHARGSQTGLICAVAVSGFEEGRIRIHEGCGRTAQNCSPPIWWESAPHRIPWHWP